MPRSLLPTLLLAALFLSACANDTPPPPPDDPSSAATIPFRKDGTLDFVRDGAVFLSIDIEIADTDSARTRGLMQRSSLPDRSGMLFIFPNQQPQAFWMSNTPLSLDLMFVNTDAEIVSITRYATPFSPESIPSLGPAQYVVEVEAGFVDTHGIVESDKVEWRRDE